MAEQDKWQELKEQLEKLSYFDWFKLFLIILGAAFLLYRIALPWRAEYAYREAFSAEAAGNRPLAIEKYLKAIRLAPWETYYHVQLGKIYEDLANAETDKVKKKEWIKKAEDLYLQCLKISPTNPWYQNRLGEIYGLYASVADTPEEAKSFLQKREEQIIKASELDPNNALFQLSVAYLYHQRKDFKKALEKYEHVLVIDDTMAEAYFNMADIYRQQGNIDKQIEMYKKIIEKKPSFKNAHLQLGRIYEQRGMLKEAANEYIEEAKLDKNNVLAFQLLGLISYRLGEWENMQKAYNRLTIIEPNNPNNYLYRAQAEIRLNRLDDAIASLEAAQALDPTNKTIANNLAHLRRMKNPPPLPKPLPKSEKLTVNTTNEENHVPAQEEITTQTEE